jgi:hypothetical protein
MLLAYLERKETFFTQMELLIELMFDNVKTLILWWLKEKKKTSIMI